MMQSQLKNYINVMSFCMPGLEPGDLGQKLCSLNGNFFSVQAASVLFQMDK